MNSSNRLLHKLIDSLTSGRGRRYWQIMLALSVVVVFVTTYMLVLPALALIRDTAVEMDGIDVLSAETAAMEDDPQGEPEADVPQFTQEDITADRSEESAEEAMEQPPGNEMPNNNDVDAAQELTVLTASRDTYSITAEYGPETGIPSDALLRVKEITDASPRYEEFAAGAEDTLGMEEGSAQYIRLFDISIVDPHDETIEYQPAQGSTVSVRIELADAVGEDMKVVHFADDAGEGKVVESTTEGPVISIDADGFSIYALVGDAVLAISNISIGAGDSMTVTTDLPAPVTWISSNSNYVRVEPDPEDSTRAVITGVRTTNTSRTITATGANGQTNTFTVRVTSALNRRRAYFYAVYPGVTDVTNYEPGKWLYIGDGFANLPEGSNGATYVGDIEVLTQPSYYQNKTITIDGETFRFSTTGEPGTFEIVWDKATWSSGANNSQRWDGENGQNTTITSSYCWHVDGHLILHSATKSTVTFYVQYPEEQSFRAVTEDNSENYWPKLINSDVLLIDITRPEQYATSQTSASTSASITPKKTKGNLEYQFDGWYTDAACTQRAVFDGTEVGTDNRNFYGRYVPVSGMYTVEYYYDGVKDDNATETYLNNQVGDTITIVESDYSSKDQNGRYVFDYVDPADTLTISSNASQNVIRVYYLSRKYPVSVWKTDLDHNALTGAGFALYAGEDYEQNGGSATPLKSGSVGADGLLQLGELAVGTYYLVETQAPAGFDPAESAIVITVDANGVTAMQGMSNAEVARNVEGNAYRQYWVSGQDDDTWQIRVWNNPGVALPSTGGPGTGILHLAGVILALVCGTMLACRRHSRSTDN